MRPVRVLASAALLAALMVTASARAQVVQNQFWGPNGPVKAVAVAGNTIYLGGTFTQVGPSTGSFLGFDASTAAPLQPYPGVVGSVLAVASDGTGGWYIGGNFTSVQGQIRHGLAHIDANGNLTPFASDFTMTGTVYTAEIDAIVLGGSTVYIGGNFQLVDGQARNDVAALAATTGALASWNPNPSYSSDPRFAWVHALLAYGSTIYIGGHFDAIGGAALNNLAAVDATTGAATGWNPNVNGEVTALGIRVLDRRPFTVTIFVGGKFTTVNNVAHWCVAGIDAGTGIPTSWAPFVSDYVRAVIPLLAGPVYVAGDFTTINGQPRQSIAAIDLSTGNVVSGWAPNANGRVYGLAILGSTLYASGNFTTIGGLPRTGLAAIDLSSGTPTSWNPGLGGYANAVAVGTNSVFAGGSFTNAGGVTRHNLAALDATTGLPTSWNPDVEGNSVVDINALAVSGSKLYVGGTFSSIGNSARTGLAAIDLNTGVPTSWGPSLTNTGSDPSVNAIALGGNAVYIAGRFDFVAGQFRDNLAAIDATSGTPTNWLPQADGVEMTALMVAGGTVYIGGDFSSMGGLTRHHLAAVDAATGSPTSWNPDVSTNSYATVSSLAAGGTNIWVGGYFDHVGGRQRTNLAAVDPIDGHANTWDDYVSGIVEALAVDGSTLYAAGQFDSVGGAPHSSLASVDLTSGMVRPWGADFNSGDEGFPGYIQSIALSGGRIIAGGLFPGVNGYAHSNLAVLSGATTAVDPVAHASQAAPLRAWPNPFHSDLALRFDQRKAGDVDVAIYDVTGRLVRRLHRGPMPPGVAQLEWDGRDQAGTAVSTGVYIVRANSGDQEESAKVLRLE